MLLLRVFQRADGWCESVPTKESSLTPESPLRRDYSCSGGRLPRYRLWTYLSPRVIVSRERTISKVVPRIRLFVLEVLYFKDFFISYKSIY